MITVYEMKTCPDCIALDKQLSDNVRFRRVDIGEHVTNMKEFVRLRDTNPAFDETKREGYIGIPCFVKEDGTICFDIEELYTKDGKTVSGSQFKFKMEFPNNGNEG